MSELVHAIVLVSHFHSLSSFVFSCGLKQQLDTSQSPSNNEQPTNQLQIQSTTSPAHTQKLVLEEQKPNNVNGVNHSNNQNGKVECLMKRMQHLSEQKNNCSDAELRDRFNIVEMQVCFKSFLKAFILQNVSIETHAKNRPF
jgi:sestrin